MKLFSEWLNEIATRADWQDFPIRKGRGSQASLEKLLPKSIDLDQVGKKKLQPTDQPSEPEYDPREEEIFADLVKQTQELLNILDIDRSDVVAIQQALTKLDHAGQVYLRYLQK